MSTIQQIQASRESFANGQKFYAANNFDDALREFRRAVQLQEVVFGKYHKETIRSYLGHGKAALSLSRQTLALQSFQRAMRMANVSFSRGSAVSMGATEEVRGGEWFTGRADGN